MTAGKIFISYAHDSDDVTHDDVERLSAGGFQISYDRGIRPGTDWREHLATELMEAGVVLYYSSRAASRSKHCLAEIGFALDLDKPILVVQLDSHELPPGLRMYLANAQAIRQHELDPAEYGATLVAALRRLVASEGRSDRPAPRDLTLSIATGDAAVDDLLAALIRLLDAITRQVSLERVSSDADIVVTGKPGEISLRVGDAASERLSVDLLRPVELIGAFRSVLERLMAAEFGVDISDTADAVALRANTNDAQALVGFLVGLTLDKSWDLTGALARYGAAIERDPEFTLCAAHAGVVALNLGHHDSSKAHMARAFGSINDMDPRDQNALKTAYLIASGDFRRAAQELEQFHARHTERANTLQNLALCYLYCRDTGRALETARKSLPRAGTYFDQANYAMYLMYAGRYEECAEKLLEIGMRGSVYDLSTTMAVCQAMLGNAAEAEKIYDAMRLLEGEGQRLAGFLGLADLHAFRGDFERACELCMEAPESEHPVYLRIAAYGGIFAAVAQNGVLPARLQRLLESPPVSASSESLYLLGRAAIHLSADQQAHSLQTVLARRLDNTSRLYSELLDAERRLERSGELRDIVNGLHAQLAEVDTWMGRFLLASAYDHAGQPMDALIEWQKCLQRSGEAVAVMLDEIPTLHLYAIARARSESAARRL